MKVICAGLPKTGTKSLAAALRMLGFTVHDYDEQMQYHLDKYVNQAYCQGILPDFSSMYSNVDALTDNPACFFWKEIKESFPQAKVILMKRDNVESWIKSALYSHEMWERSESVMSRLGLVLTPTGRTWKKECDIYIDRMKLDEQENMSKAYTEHNARVKATIPRDELLVYNVKQGWKPLCEFLGVEVPDVPFPRLNVRSSGIPDLLNQSAIAKKVFYELGFILTVFFAFVALLICYIVKNRFVCVNLKHQLRRNNQQYFHISFALNLFLSLRHTTK